ncbi:hypothetical protein [Neisseria elongata]|uniref:hypothetical protein n=1 Tax=Neisseria elongata TaxID=495 RepID=UPI000D3CE84C|nr:hypothetical protein [Neisseria elongata]
MNQATNHGMDMNQGIGIRAYVARIRKARECSPDDLRYITPNTSRKDYEHLNRGNTYFLCFFANPSGHMPQAVRVDGDADSDSLGSARERLFLAAAGDKSGDRGIQNGLERVNQIHEERLCLFFIKLYIQTAF